MADQDILDGFHDAQQNKPPRELAVDEDAATDYELGRQLAIICKTLAPASYTRIEWVSAHNPPLKVLIAMNELERQWSGYRGAPEVPAKLAGYRRWRGKEIPKEVPTVCDK